MTVLTRSASGLSIVIVFAAISGAQTTAESPDLSRLREVVQGQQERLDAQAVQLQELTALVREQGRVLEALAGRRAPDGSAGATPAPRVPEDSAPPAARFSSAPVGAGGGPSASATSATLNAPQQTPPPVPSALNSPTQEIAREAPTGAGFDVGPATFRIGGYLAVTGLYRSTNSGGNVGTAFGTIPFEATLDGSVSEARLSAQSTRLSLRVDAPLPEGSARFSRLSGYVEGDFAGSTPGNVAVSSSSVGFRLRQAFGELTYGNRVFVAVGQAFSLMTPPKGQLSIWPSDYQLTQAIDTNYIAGLAWTRQPQVRVTFRPSPSTNWAFALENPEQQVGKGRVTWPGCCAADLDAQYNTGGDELSVPNLMPDVTGRFAFNAGARLHADVGGVLRVFRHTLAPYGRDELRVAGGLSGNLFVGVGSDTRLLLEGSWGAGIGRYQGGLAPDVIVRADGSIVPVRSGSWVGGLERTLSPKASIAGYYSGLTIARADAIDANGTSIGYGFEGSPGSHNRLIHEATGVFAWYALKTKDRGSLQLNTQGSWLSRSPWSPARGFDSAHAFLFFTQLRYNLP